MIPADEVQKQLEGLSYWDSRIICLEAKWFFNEVFCLWDNEDGCCIQIMFDGCYHIDFQHDVKYNKEALQINIYNGLSFYFIQDIRVEPVIIEENHFYKFHLVAWPLELEILCKNIQIQKIMDNNILDKMNVKLPPYNPI